METLDELAGRPSRKSAQGLPVPDGRCRIVRVRPGVAERSGRAGRVGRTRTRCAPRCRRTSSNACRAYRTACRSTESVLRHDFRHGIGVALSRVTADRFRLGQAGAFVAGVGAQQPELLRRVVADIDRRYVQVPARVAERDLVDQRRREGVDLLQGRLRAGRVIQPLRTCPRTRAD